MTTNSSILEEMDTTKATTICRADGKSIKSVGSGAGRVISVDGKGGRNVKLENVFHVPSLAGNLLSVSRITDLGFRVVFDKTGCKVLKEEEAVLVGQRKGGLYHLKQLPGHDFLVDPKHSDLCQHLWHRILVHSDPQAVKKIVREHLGHGLKINACEVQSMCGCSFPKASALKTKAVGELIHVDLGGLMEKKSDAEDKIREYCALVKHQFGGYPKCICTDGGDEFMSASLLMYFAANGIVVQQTAPYTPQQNGVEERKNRTPYELWSGKKPSYAHLRIFG
ncbi:uncharacterized protein LOC134286326 [Aedes albopictus]|uniref:Integrase catalytic domain-containing protein n=1 Tax=Aedes albopictus TaxID=7160 RepID=A0ABM1Z1M8_AEDAL